LVILLNASGEFSAQTDGPGFSLPASAGAWSYQPSQRTLTATGVNNLYTPFLIQFQNIRYHDGHYDAFVPGSGAVALFPE
jgi:hypothetical protein